MEQHCIAIAKPPIPIFCAVSRRIHRKRGNFVRNFISARTGRLSLSQHESDYCTYTYILCALVNTMQVNEL